MTVCVGHMHCASDMFTNESLLLFIKVLDGHTTMTTAHSAVCFELKFQLLSTLLSSPQTIVLLTYSSLTALLLTANLKLQTNCTV